MPVFADRVKETTSTTGTGTLDLAGAVTGFRTLVAGVGDGAEVYYCIEDGTDWEVGIGTVTDAATDTLSRDTVLASSNAGAKVNWGVGTRDVFLTSPAVVQKSLREVTTAKTASFTAKVGELYPIDLSGASADFVVTFPSSPSAGDEFGWYVKTAHATHGFGCEALSTTSIRGSTSHDNKWSTWQLGELLIFRYDGATWQVKEDGRIPFMCRVTLASDVTTNTAATWTNPNFDTEDFDLGSFYDNATNFTATIKRAGKYEMTLLCIAASNVTDANYYGTHVENSGGTEVYADNVIYTGAAAQIRALSGGMRDAAAGDVLRPEFISQEANRGVDATTPAGMKSFFVVTEVLHR